MGHGRHRRLRSAPQRGRGAATCGRRRGRAGQPRCSRAGAHPDGYLQRPRTSRCRVDRRDDEAREPRLAGGPARDPRGGRLHACPRQPARPHLGVPLLGARCAHQPGCLRDAVLHRGTHPPPTHVPRRRGPGRGIAGGGRWDPHARCAALHPQSWIGRPTARRRSTSLRHDHRHRHRARSSGCASTTTSRPSRPPSARPPLPGRLADRLEMGV